MSEKINSQKLNIIKTESTSDSQKEKVQNKVLPAVNINEEIKDEYVKAKKKRGFLARFYGVVNKFLPIGVTDNKVQKNIEKYEKGEISKEEVSAYIDRYENSNFNSKEITTDALAGSAAIGVGFIGKKLKTLINTFTPKYKSMATVIIGGASVLTGILTKLTLNKIDSYGMDKQTRKEQSKFTTDLLSGSVNGVTGFLSTLNPILIPAGIAINAFTRYVNDKKDDKTSSSISDFLEKQKDTIGIGIIGLVGVSAAAAKGHYNLAKIREAINLSVKNKNHVITYRPPEGQLTEFQQLARDVGYDLSIIVKNGKLRLDNVSKLDEDFLKILLAKGENGNIEGKIKKIEQENIFLPKYLQTVVDIPKEAQDKLCKQIDEILIARKNSQNSVNYRDWNFEDRAVERAIEEIEQKGMDIEGLKDLQGILQRIKSDCPTSRDIKAAQQMLDKEYNGAYKIDKLLGVGSIAESYLAKNNKGEEVVVKIVKQHFLDADKIAADKAKILKKVDERAKDDYHFLTSKQTIKTPERKEYDINQLDNMYKVWGEEVNLSQEALSAKEIGEQAARFQPVDVIDAKPNIFIMQKAQGVQLDSSKFAQKWKDANLTEADFKNFVENYVQVYCEQLFSLPKVGKKVVQSDPHGGNILVDVEKIKDLKNGSKPITIIDYGNTTKTERAQAIKNLFNHIDYLVGNTDAIAEAMLEGAKLGKNNKKQIIKEMSAALKDTIYNPDTKIDVDNPVKIFSTVNSFCLDFMQKKNIIPNAGHINQMKAEETYIISNLGCLKNIADSCNYDLAKAVDKKVIIQQLINEMSKATQDAIKYEPTLTSKEIAKRYKFFTNNTEEAMSSLGINFGIL